MTIGAVAAAAAAAAAASSFSRFDRGTNFRSVRKNAPKELSFDGLKSRLGA